MSGSGNGGTRIVVGADGSDGSKDALRWAARQAQCTGAVVVAVIAWEWPAFFGVDTALPEGFDPSAIAGRVLDQAVRDVLGENPPAGLRTRVTEGRAGQALVDASRDAELLVVGTRGHGGAGGRVPGLGEHLLRASRSVPGGGHPARPAREVSGGGR